MHPITKNRVRLIRHLQSTADDYDPGSATYANLRALIHVLRTDTLHAPALSAEHPGKVSYARAPEHTHDPKRRVACSFGRLVRTLYYPFDSISDPVLDSINRSLARPRTRRAPGTFSHSNFSIVSGSDIPAVYADPDYPTSCMVPAQGHYGARATHFYAANPDRIQMLLYHPPDGTRARALVWTLDDGRRICDRIYPSFAPDRPAAVEIRAYLRAHNIVHRDNADLSKAVVSGLRTWANDDGFILFPYLDTFFRAGYPNGDPNTVTLTAREGAISEICWPRLTLTGTSGNPITTPIRKCYGCKRIRYQRSTADRMARHYLCPECFYGSLACHYCGYPTTTRSLVHSPAGYIACATCAQTLPRCTTCQTWGVEMHPHQHKLYCQPCVEAALSTQTTRALEEAPV